MAGSLARGACALIVLTAFGSSEASAQAFATQLDRLSQDGAPPSSFGASVAIDGDTAAVGVPRDDEAGEDAGAVLVYTRGPGGWSLRARVVSADVRAGDRFGTSVALSAGRLIVGAPFHSYNAFQGGAVFVFEGLEHVWVERERLMPAEPVDDARFGFALALDGEHLVVGAPFGAESGLAYAFREVPEGFRETQRLEPEDLPPLARFGVAVDVDGEILALGAYLAGAGSTRPGAVYTYGIGTSGDWGLEARLVPEESLTLDGFGAALALEGGRLVAGAPERRDAGPQTGAAYAFVRAAGAWHEEGRLSPSFPRAGDHFGAAVSMDGGRVLIGAPGRGGTGAAYLFQGPSGWEQALRVSASPEVPGERLGSAVALDGDACLAAAPHASFTGPSAGAVYTFALHFTSSGVVHCTGNDGCPCGNAGAPGEGCRHSGDRGMRIAALGSPSFGADDLALRVAFAPRGNAGVFLAGTGSVEPGLPLQDGLRCVRGDLRLFAPQQQWDGLASATGFLQQSPAYFRPGTTFHFQFWSRDVSHGPGACGRGGNLSPAVSVRIVP